jgi:hypothetical protein
MQKTFLRNAIAAAFILASSQVHADLPSMSKLPWIGYFMATKSKNYQITITTVGTAKLDVLNSQGLPGYSTPFISVAFSIMETLPDGKTIHRAVIPGSLASDQPAEVDPKKPMTFRGKVEGDAAFEAIFYPERGGFSFGGKVTEKGKLTNPLSFAIKANFIPYHPGAGTKVDQLEKLAKRDNIRFETTQRKRDKIEFLKEITSPTAAPEQITSAEISTEGFNRLGFKLVASTGTSFTLSGNNGKRFLEGFSLTWKTEPKTGNSAQKISFVVK